MTTSIEGCVRSPDGSPVAGINLTLVHLPTGSEFAAVTMSDGRYEFRAVRVGGPYRITVGARGGPQAEGITLRLKEVYVQDFHDYPGP